MADRHFRVCNFCEAMCGIEVRVQAHGQSDPPVFNIRPDRQDTFSKGSMCPKAAALGALHNDPERLRNPVVRRADEWHEISWPEAYQLVADKLGAIREAHGADAIGSYLGNPIVHNLGMALYVKTLTAAIGSKNVFSASSMDQLPHHFAAHYMFGHEFRIPVPDIDRTHYMLMLGANPVASNGSIMTSAGVRERLQKIAARGGRLVVIDPRRTETAKIASEHWFIKPASDIYLLLAILHIVFRDNHLHLDRLGPHLSDFARLREISTTLNPQQAAELTGIAAADIEQIVVDYMRQPNAVIYGRMGVSTQAHGGLCHWLINSINLLTGHFDRPGGMMFPAPAIELVRSRRQKHEVGRWASRVRGLAEFYGELPVSALGEEITTPGDGQIRALLTICGNPVLSTPAGGLLEKQLPTLEFMVSIDNYINETTRFANIILPTPMGLEVDHYDIIFNLISVRNNARFSSALLPVSSDRPYDWQILKELAGRLATGGLSWFDRWSTPTRIINLGLMTGRYGCLSHPRRWFSGLTLKRLQRQPHGIDLGPLQARVPEALITPDKKIQLQPEPMIERVRQLLDNEMPLRIEAERRTPDPATFFLIGRRNVNTNNSWMHQFPKLSRSKQVRCDAMINTQSAAALQIGNGDIIEVSSATGTLEIAAQLSDDIAPGVISIPHGFGHTRDGTRISHASRVGGVSVNDITDARHIDVLTGNAAFSGLPLNVRKVRAVAQAIANDGKPLLVLYGTRTGNAESIAHDAAEQARQHDLLAQVAGMHEITPQALQRAERLLVICSTYGDGEMPDNAQALWWQLQQPDAPTLQRTHYSVLALGDRSYPTFCQAGRDWDRALQHAGAQRIAERIDCDVDYLDAADRWLQRVLPMITDCGDQSRRLSASEAASEPAATTDYSRRNPWLAKLLQKRCLSGLQSEKQTMHYVLSIDGSGMQYKPGDSVNLQPRNNAKLVELLIDVLAMSADIQFPDTDLTLRQALTEHYDCRAITAAMYERLAACSAGIRRLVAADDWPETERQLHGFDIVDLLSLAADAHIALDELPLLLKKLQPRAYSIASSQLLHPNEIHLTVATVQYQLNNRDHRGVASAYLANDIDVGDSVAIHRLANSGFVLPDDPTRPIIMIGAGTGVAPFRGFLQQRQTQTDAGDSWLFFGDRHALSDYLYQHEWHSWLDSGVLTRLDTAFSRDQHEKIYVQHRMLEWAPDIYDWISRGAVIYVCGDARRMAVDVEAALQRIIELQSGQSTGQARHTLAQMKQQRRYRKDVY